MIDPDKRNSQAPNEQRRLLTVIQIPIMRMGAQAHHGLGSGKQERALIPKISTPGRPSSAHHIVTAVLSVQQSKRVAQVVVALDLRQIPFIRGNDCRACSVPSQLIKGIRFGYHLDGGQGPNFQ